MNGGRALGLIATVFACQALLAIAVIPPWQGPDEPSHVNFARIVTRQAHAPLLVRDADSEREILRSMVRHAWWQHYGRPALKTEPNRFDEVDRSSSLDGMLPGPRPYYVVAGRIASAWPGGVVGELYLLRLLSLVLGLATICVIWAATHTLFDQLTRVVVTIAAALHLQFILVSTTASPDALVNLLGVVVWWQVVRVARNPANIGAVAMLWAAAMAAVAIKRLGFPMILVAAGMTLFAVLRAKSRGWRQMLLWGVGSASAVALVGLATYTLAPDFFLSIVRRMLEGTPLIDSTQIPVALTWEFLLPFTKGFFESWWLAVGWGRYLPPSWWVFLAYALAIVALLGVVRRWLQAVNATTRIELGAMTLMILVQAAGEYWVYARMAHGAQGRHLFPCLVPALVLLWLGFAEWVPTRYRRHAAVGLIAVFALLNVSGWTRVAIPPYVG